MTEPLDQAVKVAGLLGDWIKNQAPKQESRSAPMQWVAGTVVSLAALIVVAVLYWKAYKQGQEIAKLKHERDVQVANEEYQRTKSAVAQTDIEAALAKKRANEALSEAIEITKKIEELNHAKSQVEAEITAVSNWRDLDAYLARKGNGGSP